MEALVYLKSVPRYLAARLIGPRLPAVYTTGWACLKKMEVKEPKLPSEYWVGVRPILSGICGSDLATLTAQGSTYFAPLTATPFVFGHEVVGEISECGRKAEQVRPGDRVVLEPPLHCRVREIRPPCRECARGRKAHCLNLREGVIGAGIQTGYCRDTGGGWSTRLVAHGSQVHGIPEETPLETAVLIEPFACCLQAVLKSGLSEGDTALVLGCGTIGVLTLAAIRALEIDCRVIVAAKHRHQVAAASTLQASEIVQAGSEALAEIAELVGARLYKPEVGRPTAIGGVDVTFDCVGASTTLDDAFRLTRPRGRVIVVGMPAIPKGVDWTALWHKELIAEGSYAADPVTFQKALQISSAKPRLFSGIVGSRFPLSRYREAIKGALNTGRSGVFKTVFEL